MKKPRISSLLSSVVVGTLLATASWGAWAADSAEATIRKNLAAFSPQLKVIDEVSKTAVPGLYEVRVNKSDIFYTDAQGNYLLEGSLIDLKNKRNLTEERVTKLTAVKFDSLPLKDAFTIVRGNGKRKIAIFEDPQCGYCKRFERDLQKVDNVTIYMFLYPILGAESGEKSKAIWCSKDQVKAWQDWMVRDQAIPPAPASCDSNALARNVELGRNHRITGTPTIIFPDGSRVPGAIDSKQLEKLLAERTSEK
jgi:thiol:disulfide interchange protein DsbC